MVAGYVWLDSTSWLIMKQNLPILQNERAGDPFRVACDCGSTARSESHHQRRRQERKGDLPVVSSLALR